MQYHERKIEHVFISPSSGDTEDDCSYLFKEVSCEVSRVEGCGDQDLSLKKKKDETPRDYRI